MNYCVKNDSDKPVILESIGLRVPAKSKSRVLTEDEYFRLCASGESPPGVVLVPFMMESKKPKVKVEAEEKPKPKKAKKE